MPYKCTCGRWAIYNVPGGPPIWCSKCKSEDAVNVANKKCECASGYPIYGFPGEKATWCSKCKPTNAVDVKNRNVSVEKLNHISVFRVKKQYGVRNANQMTRSTS